MTKNNPFLGNDSGLPWEALLDCPDVPLNAIDELFSVLDRIKGFAGAIDGIADRDDISCEASGQLCAQAAAIRLFVKIGGRLTQCLLDELNSLEGRKTQ